MPPLAPGAGKITYILRHLVAFLALPGVVVGVVPLLLAYRFDIRFEPALGAAAFLAAGAGALSLVAGLILFVASVQHFFTFGLGTLGPWDPPRRLVVGGPYRYVRNPMISGVGFLLFSQALLLRSVPHLVWAVFALGVNVANIVLYEEGALERRFGAAYREYRRNVPRFLPRLSPWRPPDSPGAKAGV